MFGKLFGRFLPERYQDTLSKTCGVAVLFIGTGGVLEGMLSMEGESVVSGNSMLIVISLATGAMAIVGSIQDGIFGDYSILATKAVLDFIIVLVMTCSMGKGCVFSFIPVACFQGVITLPCKLH